MDPTFEKDTDDTYEKSVNHRGVFILLFIILAILFAVTATCLYGIGGNFGTVSFLRRPATGDDITVIGGPDLFSEGYRCGINPNKDVRELCVTITVYDVGGEVLAIYEKNLGHVKEGVPVMFYVRIPDDIRVSAASAALCVTGGFVSKL